MFNFIHTFTPTAIIGTIGPLTLYWYGFMYFIAFTVAYLLVNRLLKKIDTGRARTLREDLPTFTVGLIICGLFGARIYHVITQWSIYYSAHTEKIFAVNEGGLAIHGGLIGGLLFVYWYSKKLKKEAGSLPWLLDVITPAVLLGQAIGRIGNYFNQELFGLPTNLPWGIPIEREHRPMGYESMTYFHPAFLYESLWDLVGFFLLILWQRHLLRQNKLGQGLVVFAYLVWMGLGRVLVELIRIEPAPLVFNLRWHLIVAAGIVVIGVASPLAMLFKKRSL